MFSIRFYTFFVILFFLSFSSLSLAFEEIPIHIIKSDSVKLEDFKIGYFVDKTEKMNFDKVQQQNFNVTPNALSLGTKAKVTWIKVKLKNANTTPVTIYLHQPYAYHNRKVELYEVTEGEQVIERILNMDDEKTMGWMFKGSAVFDITLAPSQHKTLFVKSHVFSHQWFAINIYDVSQSKRALLGQHTYIALAVGMLLALTIYNFLLCFTSRLKEHFFYACYLVSGGFWIALSYGLFADLFNVYGTITLKWHLSLVAMPIFLLLFMINIFETNKKYPIEHWALLSILSLLIFDFIYGLFDIYTALEYSSTLATIMMCISLSVTLSMLIRKHPIAFYFLLGHGLFVIFSTLAVLFYKGKADFNFINSHGVGIGIILEALILSLLIAYRIRSLENLKVIQADLQFLASTDPLTQLFNRRYFNNAANLLLKQAKQNNLTHSLAIIDIDYFKKINDTYGHASGDKSIKCVADVIKTQSRSQDILARYGGEEFIILMPNTFLNDAHTLIERIRLELENTKIKIDQHELVLTISAGVSELDCEDPDLEEAINKADKSLYKAKNNGRNQTQLSKETRTRDKQNATTALIILISTF